MQLTEVPGVAETALPQPSAVPACAPPAPWVCRCEAVFWVAATNRAAARVPEPAVARLGRPIAVFGGFVRYHETPVGPYDEVLGAVAFATRRGVRANVPFMAVDSPASVAGGRLNWSLPKTLAEFSGAPSAGARAAGAGWAVRAATRTTRRGLPVSTGGQLAQYWPDGLVRYSRLRVRGNASPALVRVHADSAGSLPEWLRPGRHLGVVFREMRFRLDPAEPR